MATVVKSAVLEIAANVAKIRADMAQTTKVVEQNFSKMERAGRQLRDAFAGITAGIAVGKVLRMADEYNTLQARIKSATAATKDYAAVSNELFRISQKTGASLKDSTDVFQRLSLASASLGASNKEMLALTETVQKLGVMGGASTSALNAGLLQFGQLMGSGTAHAEELNSIIENLPLVADKIAKGLGMTVAEMRSLAKEGKLTSEQVFESLKGQTAAINEEFKKMPNSFGRSMNALGESMKKALGEMDQSTGITTKLADGLTMIADHADTVVNSIVAMGASALTLKLLTFNFNLVTVAVSRMTAAMLANPLLTGAVAVTGVLGFLYAVKDEVFSIGQDQVTLANLVKATWEKTIKSVMDATKEMRVVLEVTWAAMNVLAEQWVNHLYQGVAVMKLIASAAAIVNPQLAKTVNSLIAPFKGMEDIVKRAAELTKGASGSPSDKKGAKKAPELMDEKAYEKALADLERMQKAKEKFFRQQEGINQAALTELNLGEKAAKLEELKAQFREQVGRVIMPMELQQLQEIYDARMKIAAESSVQKDINAMQDEIGLITLKKRGMEELIPYYQILNEYKRQDIKLTDDQKERLKQSALEKYWQEAAEKTREYNKSLQESLIHAAQELEMGKDTADILAKLRTIKEDNKNITAEELKDVAERLSIEKAINKEAAARKSLKDTIKNLRSQAQHGQISLIQNKEIREQAEAELSAREKMERSLTEQEKTMLRAAVSQKLFVEDAKRAAEIAKENRTDQEKYADTLDELNRLYGQGLLTFEDYARAVKKASPDFKKLSDFAKETAGAFTGALDDILFKSKSIKESFKDMAKTLVQSLTKKLLFDPLERGIENFIKGLWNPTVPGGGQGGSSPLGGLANIFGLGGGFGGANKAPGAYNPLPNIATSNQGGAVYARGPVYINGAQVAMNQPAINAPLGGPVSGNYNFTSGGSGAGLLGGAQDMIKNLFSSIGGMLGGLVNGIRNIFSNGVSGLLSSVSKLFTGGLSSLFGTGGISNLFSGAKNLLTAGLGGGGIGSLFGGLGGLLNIPQALSVAMRPLFGGARARGGGVKGGQLYLTGERGPELFFPGSSGFVMPATESQAFAQGVQAAMTQQEISRMINSGGLLGGTPAYKENGNEQYWGGEWQAKKAWEKIQYWQSLSPFERATLQAREPWRIPTTADNMEIARGRNRLWTDGGLEKEYREAMNRFAILEGQAMVDKSISGQGFDVTGNVGQEFIRRGKGGFFTGTFNAIGTARGGVGPAEGNQSTNFMTRLRQMGVPVSDTMLSFLNVQDQMWDVINPGNVLPPMLALGSKEGMGGGGSGAYSRGGAASYGGADHFAPGRGRYTRVGPMPEPGFTPPGTPGRGTYTPPSAGSPFRNNPGGQIWGPGAPGMGRNAQTNGRFYGGPGIEERNRLIPGERGVTGNDGRLPSVNELIRRYGYEYGGDAGNFWRNPGGGSVYARPEGSSPYTRQFPSDFSAGVAPGGVRGIDTGWGLATPDVFQRQTPVMTTGRPQLYYPSQNSFNPPNLATGFSTGIMDLLMGRVKGYARGGRPSVGDPAVVGEMGPELFVPDTAGKILPNSSLRGGAEVNVYTNTTIPVEVGKVISGGGRRVDVMIDDLMASQIQAGGRASRAAARTSRQKVGR